MRKGKFFTSLCACLLLLSILLVGCGEEPTAPPVTEPTPPVTETPPEETPTGSTQADYFNVKGQGNLFSRDTATFDNINGKTVTVDTLRCYKDEKYNNPNFAQAILLEQCIRYKKAHPEEEVYASVTSFHLSVVASACLDKSSEEYGLMKSLYDSEYDEHGYVRLSYLMVQAAQAGIYITIVGHTDANPVVVEDDGTRRGDHSFVQYFDSHLDSDSDIPGKKIRDFMTVRKAEWTSYGDKAASDMMHIKSCTVTNYMDENGTEYGPAVWVGSINIDGIDKYGYNGNNNLQTGVVLTNHEEIRRVVYNYTVMMKDYCAQEGIALFRDLIRQMNTEQIALIEAGEGDTIPLEERIVYLGGAEDRVFEFYFTPVGGSIGTWDTTYNPYCKYVSKLLPAVSGAGDITFAWNNVKYLNNFEFAQTLADVIANAFIQSGRKTNKLHLYLPGFNTAVTDPLVAGENIGMKNVNRDGHLLHNKDFQLSYIENGTRYYVTVFNSLNFHQGAVSYQTNTFFVIKETNETGNHVYVSVGDEITFGIISKADLVPKPQKEE